MLFTKESKIGNDVFEIVKVDVEDQSKAIQTRRRGCNWYLGICLKSPECGLMSRGHLICFLKGF